MTVATSPNQPPRSSPAGSRNHSRRGSTRVSAFSPHIESPRTLCPRDGDAFSYDPAHLAEWYIPQELWDRLNGKLQATLAAMQHSGAAVLTGFERLEKQSEEFEDSEFTHKLREAEAVGELDALPPPKMRTTSDASSVFFSDVASPIFTGTPSSGSTSPSVVDSQATSPVSPICLNPFDAYPAEKRERSHERPYSMPREPHDVYYAAELSHLRTEALTRLRHTALKVDQEWKDVKRSQALSPNDIKDFDDWWSKKKATVRQLNEKCKRLSAALGLSPGGMGWTYAP